jgi:hypothetical protein
MSADFRPRPPSRPEVSAGHGPCPPTTRRSTCRWPRSWPCCNSCATSTAFDLLMDSPRSTGRKGPRRASRWSITCCRDRPGMLPPRSRPDLCGYRGRADAPSVVSLWPGANWHERECYDMFGIKFEGHPDLRRILMWDGYPYHPLRKEFPLAGIETELPGGRGRRGDRHARSSPRRWRAGPSWRRRARSTSPKPSPGRMKLERASRNPGSCPAAGEGVRPLPTEHTENRKPCASHS